MVQSTVAVRRILAWAIPFALVTAAQGQVSRDSAGADKTPPGSLERRAGNAGPISPSVRKLVSDLGGRFRNAATLDGRKFSGVSLMNRDAHATDDDVRILATIPELCFFECYADRMTSDGLQCLANVPTLKVLDLWDSRFNDADLERISKIPIERLGLYRCTGITDSSVKHFSRNQQG